MSLASRDLVVGKFRKPKNQCNSVFEKFRIFANIEDSNGSSERVLSKLHGRVEFLG